MLKFDILKNILIYKKYSKVILGISVTKFMSTILILILLAIVHGEQEIEVAPNDAAEYQEALAKSHWLKPLRDCQNLMGISLLPIQIRFCSGARKTSLSFCITNYKNNS